MSTMISIDPGSNGFITLFVDGKPIEFFSIAVHDNNNLAWLIKCIKSEYDDVKCVMEEVHAIFGSAAKSTFAFGEINGFLKGLLTANCIPYTLVQPKMWQKEVWINQDIEYDYKQSKNGETRKTINTKKTSYNACRRLFPDVDLRKTEKCKKYDDNKVDSILIGEYARRKNL